MVSSRNVTLNARITGPSFLRYSKHRWDCKVFPAAHPPPIMVLLHYSRRTCIFSTKSLLFCTICLRYRKSKYVLKAQATSSASRCIGTLLITQSQCQWEGRQEREVLPQYEVLKALASLQLLIPSMKTSCHGHMRYVADFLMLLILELLISKSGISSDIQIEWALWGQDAIM